MRLVHERWPATVIALAGVLLALPSVALATWQQAVVARDRGEVVVRELVYSWGRADLVEAGGSASTPGGNSLALVGFAALLVVAAAAAVAWLVLPRRLALLAPLGVALLAGRLVGTVTERHGRSFAPGTQQVPGLAYVADSTVAGWAETASLVVVLAAVGLMAWALLTARPPAAGTARLPLRGQRVEPDALADVQSAEHLVGPVVSFSDVKDGRTPPPGSQG